MSAATIALACLVLVAPARATELLAPDPALSPAEVVVIQLEALQANEAESDAGIAQTFAFAHPDNQRLTGPLPRFAQMIKGPQYRMLLNHRAHEVREVARTDREVVFAVTITTSAGDFVGYRWTVARVSGGEHDGAWMTIAVSPPLPVGEAI